MAKYGFVRTAFEFNKQMRNGLMLLVGVLAKADKSKNNEQNDQKQLNLMKGFLDKSKNIDILLLEAASHYQENHDEYLSHLLKNVKEVSELSSQFPFDYDKNFGIIKGPFLKHDLKEANILCDEYDYAEGQLENMTGYAIAVNNGAGTAYAVIDWGFMGLTGSQFNLRICGAPKDVDPIVEQTLGLDEGKYPLLKVIKDVEPIITIHEGKEHHFRLVGDKREQLYDLLSKQYGERIHADVNQFIPRLVEPLFEQHDNVVYCNRLKQ